METPLPSQLDHFGAMIKTEDARIQQLDQELEDLAKFIEEDKKVANDKSERDDVVRVVVKKLKTISSGKKQVEGERTGCTGERTDCGKASPLRAGENKIPDPKGTPKRPLQKIRL